VSTRVADGDGTDNLSMIQCVHLAGMTWDARADQGIWREWYWLHLAVGSHME
jgi:hypothetical protein